mmetsp:Transcript_4680/g.12810  ORF Transcript_4680/g.12810 Transcript_4680/m.12810 type:complete len:225 (-) Transcript_4680:2872-3546(-)
MFYELEAPQSTPTYPNPACACAAANAGSLCLHSGGLLDPLPHIPELQVLLHAVGWHGGRLHIAVVKVVKVGGVQGVANPRADGRDELALLQGIPVQAGKPAVLFDGHCPLGACAQPLVGVHLQQLEDEVRGSVTHKVGHIETTRQGAPERVPRVPCERLEGRVSHKHLKNQHAQGPVVSCAGRAAPHDHLRALVVWGPADGVRLFAAYLLGKPEVRQLDVAMRI